jgi:hypothetical protein
MNYEELVKDHAPEMIDRLIKEVVKKNPADIFFNFEEEDQWAIITMHDYKEDKEISLRLHPGDVFDLHLGYYDEDDEFFEIVKVLSEQEKGAIPEGLKKLMRKVLADEEGMRVPGNLLSK